MQPAEAQLPLLGAQRTRALRLVLGRERVGAGVAGLEARVVGGGRQQVAHAEVAGGDPLLPGQPLRRHQRALAGQQHDLVDGGDLRAGGPGDGDGPAPTQVRR